MQELHMLPAPHVICCNSSMPKQPCTLPQAQQMRLRKLGRSQQCASAAFCYW